MRGFCTCLLLWCTAVSAVFGFQQTSAPAPVSVAAGQSASSEALDQALTDYRSGKFDEAIAKYKAVLEQDPKSGEAFAGITRCLLKQQKVAEAFQEANAGLAAAPDSSAAQTAHAEVLFRQAHMYEADVEWVKVANSPHPDARAFLGIARLDYAMSLYASARRVLERAYQLDPNDPDIKRRWFGTQSPAERLKFLEDYLSIRATTIRALVPRSSTSWNL